MGQNGLLCPPIRRTLSASFTAARTFSGSLSQQAAIPLNCLSVLKNRSTRLRCRQTYEPNGRLSFGLLMAGIFAQACFCFAMSRRAFVYGLVGQQNCALANVPQHHLAHFSIMGLANGQVKATKDQTGPPNQGSSETRHASHWKPVYEFTLSAPAPYCVTPPVQPRTRCFMIFSHWCRRSREIHSLVLWTHSGFPGPRMIVGGLPKGAVRTEASVK